MRQRPIDINQTAVFVNTQPRPAYRSEYGRRTPIRSPDGGAPTGEEMSGRRAATLLALSIIMLLAGAYLVTGNQYAHLHRKIQQDYYEYLEAWDQDFRAAFAASSWTLHVEGHTTPLSLTRTTTQSKRVPTPTTSSTSTSTSSSDNSSPTASTAGNTAPAANSGGRHSHRRQHRRSVPRSSALIEFKLNGLLEVLSPSKGTHGSGATVTSDQLTAAHSGLWRPVGPELRMARNMTLKVVDGIRSGGSGEADGSGNAGSGSTAGGTGGRESVLDLGRIAFSRELTVPAGGEARCMYEQHGTWQPDSTCAVHEFLWALCVRVIRDPATGAFSLATSPEGGGPLGCEPGGGEPGQWRRLDERRNRIHGRLYLPQSARNAMIVRVRHAAEPGLLEADLVRQLAPNVEQQILLHAVGLALSFLGIVLLMSVAVFVVPRLVRLLKGNPGSRRRRSVAGGGGAKHSDDEGLGHEVRAL